jgi:hypothetical protein
LKQNLSIIKCHPFTKIYIYCPAGLATGGPEALHQLGAKLIELGFNAFMYYYWASDNEAVVHENYKKYNVPLIDTIENRREHIMIFPETNLIPIFDTRFKAITKIVWWLSVDNYHITQKDLTDLVRHKRFFKLRRYFGSFGLASFKRLRKRKDIVHISHSYYSKVHLLENGIEPIGRISDYMNSAFFSLVDEKAVKENLIIYNPKKNDEFLEEIINLTPALNWVPIKDMTPAEVAGLMNRSKLYIDFGYHPGKERMPREACIMKCCMIIGKSGSAAHQEDMPIPEKYRFEKNRDQIQAIIQRINECLNSYDKLIADFEPYRQALYREEEEFVNDIKKVFVKV